MSFAPVIPFGGYAGWRFLDRTAEVQSARLSANPANARDISYFRENIGKVTSAEELVADYRLLNVALTAFGLQDDLPNKAFIERILSDGVTDENALANRLADKRYREFSEVFGFGSPLPPLSRLPGFADKIITRFEAENFEQAVGEVNGELRLALNAASDLPDIAAEGGRESTLWYRIMGNPPLREVMETALGLPSSVGGLDLEWQLQIFQDRADALLGSSDASQFTDPDKVENLIQQFLSRSQLAQGSAVTSSASVALTLLRGY